ncbi:MAG: tungstate ABC transporter substrate-binding protein WtpA [Bacteroidota bacterium]|nr:tungstate ABC transporter substrate-binding protein WtpA [Bacteroidota bacterium]
MNRFTRVLSLIALIALMVSCNPSKTKNQKLIVFHAGSLSLPMKEMAAAFEKENPGVRVLLESNGSVACARKITDLKQPCDIMASADYKVIDQMLVPAYADWNMAFGLNEMAIVFAPKAKYASEMNGQNWYKLLEKKDVRFGRSDPNADPCGYRAVQCMQLSERYYKNQGLEKTLLNKDNGYIRPKEVDLLALLESNTIDYTFLYRSVAEQHHLKYLVLPDSVNLKNKNLADWYATSSVEINGKKPGEKIAQKGEPMIYSITVLKNAPNKALAEKFVAFLADPQKGKTILEKNGQPCVSPVVVKGFEKLPASLKKLSVKW